MKKSRDWNWMCFIQKLIIYYVSIITYSYFTYFFLEFIISFRYVRPNKFSVKSVANIIRIIEYILKLWKIIFKEAKTNTKVLIYKNVNRDLFY